MVLTYKIKHNFNLNLQLEQAFRIAKFCIKHRTLSSRDVKQFGLKSMLSNQILRKYSRNRKTRRINSVNLVVPNQGIQYDRDNQTIRIPSLQIELGYQFRNDFTKINQIEISKQYIYVSCCFPELPKNLPSGAIGVDLNATGHVAVVADSSRGKVLKLGKSGNHIHRVYQKLRKKFQRRSKFRKLRALRRREARRSRDLNHKISRRIVNYAHDQNAVIKLEYLKRIRDNVNRKSKFNRKLKTTVNNWSFYQLQQFIEYKAKLLGITVQYVDPQYTSQECSRCGLLGERNAKKFVCPHCANVDHADVNAAFNIAERIGRDFDRFYHDEAIPKVA
jgi:putative transposase